MVKSLVSEIDRILMNEQTLTDMKTAAKKLGIPDAANRLYNLMGELVEKKK